MSSGPAINGQLYTHASITVNIDGTNYYGVSSINYGSEREAAGVFGTSPNQVGTALGNLSHTGDLEMPKSHAQRLRAALGNGFMGRPCTIVVTYRETAMSELITDNIAAVIKKTDTSSSNGGDPVKDKFELHVTRIAYNGILPVEEET